MDNASQVAYGQQVPLDADANLVGVDDDAYQYNERDTQSGPGEHQQQQLVGGLPLCYDRTGTTSSYRYGDGYAHTRSCHKVVRIQVPGVSCSFATFTCNLAASARLLTS